MTQWLNHHQYKESQETLLTQETHSSFLELWVLNQHGVQPEWIMR